MVNRLEMHVHSKTIAFHPHWNASQILNRWKFPHPTIELFDLDEILSKFSTIYHHHIDNLDLDCHEWYRWIEPNLVELLPILYAIDMDRYEWCRCHRSEFVPKIFDWYETMHRSMRIYHFQFYHKFQSTIKSKISNYFDFHSIF